MIEAADKVIGRVTTNGILEGLNVSREKRDRAMEMRIGTILLADGWVKNENRNAKPRYWYAKPG